MDINCAVCLVTFLGTETAGACSETSTAGVPSFIISYSKSKPSLFVKSCIALYFATDISPPSFCHCFNSSTFAALSLAINAGE